MQRAGSKRKIAFNDRAGGRTQVKVSLYSLPVPKDDPNAQAISLNIGRRATSIMQRCDPSTLTGSTVALIVNAVAHSKFGSLKVIRLPFMPKGEVERMQCSILHLDPVSRTHVGTSISFAPSAFKDVNQEDIPDVERLCRFVTGNSRHIVQVA
jgi:hypothetical protein